MGIRKNRYGGVFVAAALVLALAGCAGGPGSADPPAGQADAGAATGQEPSSSDAEETAPSEVEAVETESSGEPEPLVVPGCEQLNPGLYQAAEDWVENYPGHGELTIEESVTEVDTEVFYNLAGPVASSAMDDAQSVHGCSWGYGWEFVTWQWVVELDDEGLHALINGLRGDDGLTETSLNGVPVFEYEVPGGVHDTATIVYAFLDNVWIALVHGSDEMIADTIETLMAANPGLGAS